MKGRKSHCEMMHKTTLCDMLDCCLFEKVWSKGLPFALQSFEIESVLRKERTWSTQEWASFMCSSRD